MELRQEVIHQESTSSERLARNMHSSNHSVTQGFEGDWGATLDHAGIFGPLGRLEIMAILTTLMVCLTCIIGVLVMHYHNSQIQMATDQYIQKTADIQKQSKNLSESITQQYNYGKISEVVQDSDMSIDKSQIRNVDHE